MPALDRDLKPDEALLLVSEKCGDLKEARTKVVIDENAVSMVKGETPKTNDALFKLSELRKRADSLGLRPCPAIALWVKLKKV